MTDETRPLHDEVAEEMDLMTHQEAAARIYDSAEAVRIELAQLVSAGADAAEIQRLQDRIADLEAAAVRIGGDRGVAPGRPDT